MMKLSRRIAGIFGTVALAGALFFSTASPAHARVFVEVGVAPPPIPVYAQPAIPGDGYIWTPGYWAWNGDGYVWVDGAWVLPPYEGALWTPGYWGWGPGGYFWNAGYWGPVVGYYGGINYGFGYFGTGFYGGYWRGGHFWYNGAYNHFGPGFHTANFYNSPVHGFSARPGGASFVHANAAFNGAHGSYVNGRSFAGTNGAAFSRTAVATPSHFGGFGSSAPRTFSGNSFNGARSFAAPSQGRSMGNFASAQPRANYGGGYHGGGFGGGSFHGGGGHSGGGHR